MAEAERAKIAKRFWSKVDRTGDCWEWLTGTDGKGYGVFWADGKMRRATQAALWLETGEWPARGAFVCHRCDNRGCVRPSHLFVGSHADNMLDMAQKQRHGQSKLTPDDVRAIRASTRSQRDLAEEYGVHHTTIRGVRLGHHWTHVEPAEPLP